MKLLKLSALLFCLSSIYTAEAQIRLPKLISDNMVLQREQPIKIWGWAEPKEKITLTFNKKNFKTITAENGKWEIILPAQPTGTGFEMFLKGKNEISIKNIAFGDVWLCSGQSNMVTPMERVKEKYPDDITNANFPDIRNFFVQTLTDLNAPKDDFPQGQWKAANPKDILAFPANLPEKFTKNIKFLLESSIALSVEHLSKHGLVKVDTKTSMIFKEPSLETKIQAM